MIKKNVNLSLIIFLLVILNINNTLLALRNIKKIKIIIIL